MDPHECACRANRRRCGPTQSAATRGTHFRIWFIGYWHHHPLQAGLRVVWAGVDRRKDPQTERACSHLGSWLDNLDNDSTIPDNPSISWMFFFTVVKVLLFSIWLYDNIVGHKIFLHSPSGYSDYSPSNCGYRVPGDRAVIVSLTEVPVAHTVQVHKST